MKGDPQLSVAIIIKDEEKNLPACLSSVGFADDIVVVDSGSTDTSVEIAKEFGCRVFTEEWKGFGPQKNSALKKCLHDWVIILDADERVPAETQAVIKRLLQHPEAGAYSFRRKNFLHGRWMKNSGYWPDRQVRLVNRSEGEFSGGVHEKWVTHSLVKRLDATIEHYSFAGYADMLKVLDSYSSIAAKELYASGCRAGLFAPLLHGAGMFLKIYLLKKGFLDGFDGLVTAVTKAGGAFFKYAKLIELQNEEKK